MGAFCAQPDTQQTIEGDADLMVRAPNPLEHENLDVFTSSCSSTTMRVAREIGLVAATYGVIKQRTNAAEGALRLFHSLACDMYKYSKLMYWMRRWARAEVHSGCCVSAP